MSASERRVEPEVLDDLAADDPRALRARRDLRRVHVAMRSVGILERALARVVTVPPRRIVEFGAGDGTLLLRLARRLHPAWVDVELTLLDRLELVSDRTREAYRALGWRVTTLRADVLEWAAAAPREHYDLGVANLFLHHFTAEPLALLLAGVRSCTDAFVACEPHRSRFALLGSRLIGLLGANAVTREDAVKSVAAGFTGTELSTAWRRAAEVLDGTGRLPGTGDWETADYAAPPFTQCFVAARRGAGNAHP